MKASLVLKNASIYTVNSEESWAEAIAIADEEIVYVGMNTDVEAFIDADTLVVDLEGKMVLPGFVDAHAHPSLATDFFVSTNLYLSNSPDTYESKIADFIAKYPNKEFYRGGGWSDTFSPNLGPSKEILDILKPDIPIALTSYDQHSIWVNSALLEKAGITKDPPDPEGGRIERDPDTGDPSGIFRERVQ